MELERVGTLAKIQMNTGIHQQESVELAIPYARLVRQHLQHAHLATRPIISQDQLALLLALVLTGV